MVGDQLASGHDPGQHAAYVKSCVQVLKEDPKEILRASCDADKFSSYVLALEKERFSANMEKLPQVERPAALEKPTSQPAPRRLRAAGGREH
jgi:antirestriction protein ArdC